MRLEGEVNGEILVTQLYEGQNLQIENRPETFRVERVYRRTGPNMVLDSGDHWLYTSIAVRPCNAALEPVGSFIYVRVRR